MAEQRKLTWSLGTVTRGERN